MATVEQVTRASYQGRFDDQMSAGADAAAASMRKLGTAVVETDDKVTRATRSADSWLRSADPMTAASQRLTRAQQQQAAAQKALNSDIAAGGERQAAAERALAALTARVTKAREDLEALERANAGAGAAISGVGNSARLTTRELQLLSPQIADVGVTLAGGMNPLMVLIQQGPQITDAVGGIGRAFTLLRAAAMTPAAAIVAVGASLATVTIIAESQGRALANLSNRLRATRDDYEALATATEAAARRAAATTSISTGDARLAGGTIAGARNFTGGEAELTNLITLSGRLATVMGTDVATAAGKMAEALDKPRQAAEAMAASGLRTMDEGLVRTIRSLENQGRVAEAARLTIDAYNRAIGEVAKTPLQRATEELSNAFTRLWQGLQPIVVGLGTGVVQFFTAVTDLTSRLVNGINSLGAALRDTNVARFLFGDVQPPAAVSSASGETPLERQLRLAREASPRFLQQRDNREQAGATREALAGASGDDARLLRSRLTELNEAYRGMQGPVADYLKGLRDQAAISGVAEGAERDLAQATQQAAEVGGDATVQAEARRLVQVRLTNDLEQGVRASIRLAENVEMEARAYREGAAAAREARIAGQANTDARKIAAATGQEFGLVVDILTEKLTREAEAQDKLNAARTVYSQEQQLELIQRETELVGAGVVVRERELAILRERQRIMATGEAAPGADDPRLANAGRIAEATQALQRQQSAFQEIQRVGEQAFDRIGNAITTAFANGTLETLKFSNVVRAAASEMAQAFIRLAVLNPVKNSLGGNSPVLSLGGFGGTLGGPAAASTAGSTEGGLNQAGQALALRSAGSYGNLGQAFTGQGLANTGLGFVDTTLNAPIFGTGGALQGPTLSGAPLAGVDGLTVAGGLGGAAGIAGGAFSIYSGIQKGGIGGAAQIGSGVLSAGAGAALLAGLGSIGPAGWAAIAALAIAGAILPGEKASGKGQEARIDLATGEQEFNGLGGKRFSQANRDSATSAVNSIADLARQVGDKLGGARIGGEVAVGVTSSRGNGPGTLYLDVSGRRSQFANDEDGSKQLAEQAARFILEEFKAQGAAQGDYAGILNASGSLDALQQNLDWYEKTYKVMTQAAEPVSAFAQSIQTLTDQFAPAITKAQELSLSVDAMTAARDREVQKLTAQRDAQLGRFDTSLSIRAARLAGNNAGADLLAFNLAAVDEIEQARQALTDLGLSAEDVATRIARTEQTLAEERLAIVQRSQREIVDWLNGQSLGASSSLSPTARLAEAERQFSAAVSSGDARTLTTAADALLSNSQAVFGSASAEYAQREGFIRQTVANRGSGEAATVTALSQMTTALQAELASLRQSFDDLVAETRRANNQAMVA